MVVQRPEALTPGHKLDKFSCGEVSLDQWLIRRAQKNELLGASRTFVVSVDSSVIGYYCLSTGAVEHRYSPSSIKRNMPDPIPVMLLGRLAVDTNFSGKGIGRGLVKDALLRCLNVSKVVGVRAVLVHAINEEAAAFYTKVGFISSPMNKLTLMIPLKSVKEVVA